MEYVCLMSALITLFCGLLFFLDNFPLPAAKLIAQIIAITVVIGSSISVAGMLFLYAHHTIAMILWDVKTRIRKSKERYRIKRQKLFSEVQQLKQQSKPFMHLVHRLNGSKTRYHEDGSVEFTPPLFWNVRESEEEKMTNLAELTSNLFSWTRFKRNWAKLRQKRAKHRKAIISPND